MKVIAPRQCSTVGCTCILPADMRITKCPEHRPTTLDRDRQHRRPCDQGCGRTTVRQDTCHTCRYDSRTFIGSGTTQKTKGHRCRSCEAQPWRRPLSGCPECKGAYGPDPSERCTFK